MRQKLVATIPGVLMLLGATFHSTAVDAQSSPSAYTKGYRYDVAGRLTGTIAPDPDGAGPLRYLAVRYTYDSVGNLTAVETGSLSAWKSEAVAPTNWGADFKAATILNTTYDALGRKTIERTHGVDAGGSTLLMAVTQYSYDAQGRPECTAVRMNPAAFANPPSSACALGAEGSFGPDRITRQVYDGAGRLRTVQKAYGTLLQQDYVTYTYTPNGSVETATDANGNKTQYTYDAHGRLKRWQFPHKTNIGSVDATDFEEYGYDENGNRTSLRKRDERTITFSYDALNRVRVKTVPTSASGAPGYTVYNDYDLRGLQLYARFGSDIGQGITNTYDGAGRLRLSRSNLGGVTRDVASDYDADGNRTRTTHPDGNYFEYAYDGLDRFFRLSQNGPSTTLASLSYDARGRRDNLARDALGTATQYGYDPISRLSALTHDLDSAGTDKDFNMGFVYNPAGQILTRSLTNNAYESPVASSNLTYAVNGLNQYKQISGDAPATFVWDANGNLTSDGATTFKYDSENRLRSASGAKNATLTYDPLGRLYEVATASSTTRLVHDGDHLIAEYDASGSLQRRYVHGPGVDEPVVWYEGSQVSAANRRYLHANHQGSIVAVTGASGNTLQVNRYDPYGIAAAGNTGRFQYTGQMAIPELGLLYYKARFYNAGLGRFMQTDPVGYEADFNLYAYVGNDPLNATDPDGLNPAPLFRSQSQTPYWAFAQYQREHYAKTGEWVTRYPGGRDENMPKFAMIWATAVTLPFLGSAEVVGGAGAGLASTLSVPTAVVRGEAALSAAGGSPATARIGMAVANNAKGFANWVTQSVRTLFGRTGLAVTMEAAMDVGAGAIADGAAAARLAEMARQAAAVQEIAKAAEVARKAAEAAAATCVVTASCSP